jgi:hypothetical protein
MLIFSVSLYYNLHIKEKTMKYRGIIVEEGLNDNRILNNVTVLKMHITGHEQKNERWHLFEVEIEEEFIENIAKEIVGNWYAHFWHGTDVIAVFSNKLIKFNYLDKNTWKEVMEYGRKLDIPEEQLDFPIFGL